MCWRHTKKKSPTTSLGENFIEFEFQTDRNYYSDSVQTYLALKLKFVEGRSYETCKTKEVKKEHEKEVKADEETMEEEQEVAVSLVTHANNIWHSFFCNVEVYINSQQIYNSNGLYAHKSYFPTKSRGPSLIKRQFC